MKKNLPAIVVRTLEQHFKLKPGSLLLKDRHEELAWPRQIAMVIMLAELGMNKQTIAAYFKLDRSSVHHAQKAVANRTQTNPKDWQHVIMAWTLVLRKI